MKTTSKNPENAILKMARKNGVVRAREIRVAGLHRISAKTLQKRAAESHRSRTIRSC